MIWEYTILVTIGTDLLAMNELGAQGWEAYGHIGNTHFFKRLKKEKAKQQDKK